MKKIGVLLLTLVFAVSLTACGGGGGSGGGKPTVTSTYTHDNGIKVSLSFPDSDDYRWTEDKDDFRLGTWKAAIVGPDVKVGINVQGFGFGITDFAGQKARASENSDLSDAVYGGIKGYSYYYGGYTSYVVSLPAEGSNQLVQLWVSEPDNKESLIDELFESDTVQRILNSVKIEVE